MQDRTEKIQVTQFKEQERKGEVWYQIAERKNVATCSSYQQ